MGKVIAFPNKIQRHRGICGLFHTGFNKAKQRERIRELAASGLTPSYIAILTGWPMTEVLEALA